MSILETKFKQTFGRVVEPKILNSKQILVKLVELHPFSEGELKADPGVIKAEGVNKTDQKYMKEIETDDNVIATWMPMDGGNRSTPPDVRRNERVFVWQYEQSDEYYWSSIGLDAGYRRLETVIYRFSNTQDESVTELSDDNSWWLEVSTHKKTFTFKTNMSDGEQFAYVFQIDAKTGSVLMGDNLNNSVLLDSANTLIELENANNTLVSLNKTNLLLKATDSVTVETKTFTVESDTSTINGSSAVNVKGGGVTVDGTKFTVNPAAQFNGSGVKHKAKKIGGDHTHTPPGGPVTP